MGRSPCCDKNGLKKGPWIPEEDMKLITYIQTHGPGNWRILPKNAGLQRCGKSCRLRWANYLRPDIKRGRFSFEEEETIIQLHSVLGNKWSAIAARLPGRTDNEIKNFWNTHIRKRLLRNGIDPVTHAPRLDLLDLSSILSSTLCSQSLLGLSSLLGTEALLNPEMLRLVNTLLALNKQENPETLLQQYLQKNQFQAAQTPQEVPTCTTSTAPSMNQTQLMQGEVLQSEMGNFGCQNSQQNMALSSLGDNYNFVSQPNHVPLMSENSNFQSLDGSHNFSFDSVMSTPMSSPTPLNSPSFINGSSIEDERESFSSLLKFEIPESLDISDFM
ncbi:hypothetical protein SLE2022_051000 [Rubroshorea leprosula]